MRASVKSSAVILVSLAFFIAAVWVPQVPGTSGGALTVSFLDVGQGDAIFIESPTGKQVLIDGGPNREVLRQLGDVMPWNDKTIDVVIATHPDADHVVGLIDVLQRFDVSLIIEPGVQHDAQHVESLLKAVANEEAELILARRGERIELGGGSYLEILFPDRDVSRVDPNTASVVAKLVYGDTSFLFTGDAPDEIERYLIELDGEGLDADVLKVGHHGSKTSSAPEFVDIVSPEYAVFSRGCDNRYGHPHADVAAVFAAAAVSTLDTCEDGRVTFISDGTDVRRR